MDSVFVGGPADGKRVKYEPSKGVRLPSVSSDDGMVFAYTFSYKDEDGNKVYLFDEGFNVGAAHDVFGGKGTRTDARCPIGDYGSPGRDSFGGPGT